MNILLKYKNEIIAVVIVLIFIFVVKGVFSNNVLKMAQLEEKRKGIAEKKDLINNWRIVNSRYQAFQKEFFYKDTLSFKKFIEKEAQDSGLSISSLRPSQKDEGFYWEAKIDLDFSSGYENIVRFLGSLAKKNIDVETLTIRNIREGKNIGMILKGIILKERQE